jgi:hypothetical protein
MEEFAKTKEITVQISKTNPPAFSLSKNDWNNPFGFILY